MLAVTAGVAWTVTVGVCSRVVAGPGLLLLVGVVPPAVGVPTETCRLGFLDARRLLGMSSLRSCAGFAERCFVLQRFTQLLHQVSPTGLGRHL